LIHNTSPGYVALHNYIVVEQLLICQEKIKIFCAVQQECFQVWVALMQRSVFKVKKLREFLRKP